MKRAHSTVNAKDVAKTKRRKRKQKDALPSIMAIFCPSDQEGPRIPTLLREFGQTCNIPSHINWLHHLQTACEGQGCHLAECSNEDYFSQTHGAKTLVNSITMFLTYYVPRKVMLTSDDEWRQALAALRTFHNFCVRQKYVKEDGVLMTALHKLRRFYICTIPDRIEELARTNYWGTLEESEKDDNDDESAKNNDTADSTILSETCNRKDARSDANAEDSAVSPKASQDDEFDTILGDDEPLTVAEILEDGWVVNGESMGEIGEVNKAFLQLPNDVAKLGMQGMSLSGMQLGLKNEIWRPILLDGIYIANAYPPDDVFYY